MISIVELLLNALIAVLKIPLLLIPTIHLPQDAQTALTSGFTLIGTLGYFVPLSTIASVGAILLLAQYGHFIWDSFIFIYKMIRRGHTA